jgi:peptidoglycan/LPS O-acetylase OafA/YrhL
LDGLRGLAILLVLSLHYFVSFARPYAAPASTVAYAAAALRLAWSGVDLFFVLSGFLIGGILLDARDSPNYFRTFYARRAYRILPLYAVLCALLVLGTQLSLADRLPSLRHLLANPIPWLNLTTFTQNYWLTFNPDRSPFLGATWSLAVEEQFYLTLPLIIRFARRSHLPYILACIIVAAPLSRALLFFIHPEWNWAPYAFTFCRADALMLGVLGALLVRSRTGLALLSRHKRALYLVTAVLLAGMALLTYRRVTVKSFDLVFPGYTWIALFYLSLLLIAVTHQQTGLTRVLRNRALTGLGAIAYGTYLLHAPVLYACFGVFGGTTPRLAGARDVGITLLALLLTLTVAKFSWELFEKPLVRRGHRHRYDEEAAGEVPRGELEVAT